LQNNFWAGNVRDLEHVIENAVILSKSDILEADDLELIDPAAQRQIPECNLPDLAEGFSMEDYLDEIRCKLIHKAIDLSDGNQRQTAELLGISQQAVSKFLKRNNLSC
jgi:transcriptional regulator with PAS, ATPase and Fis domain